MNNSYYLACWIVGFALALSGASKLTHPRLLQAKDGLNEFWARLVDVSNTRLFAIVEVWLGASFWLLDLNSVRSVIAVALFVLVASGSYLRWRQKSKACNCFGSLTPSNPRWLLLVDITLICVSIFVAVIGPISKISAPPAALQVLGSMISVSVIGWVCLRQPKESFPEKRSEQPARLLVQPTSLPKLEALTPLGRSRGGDVVQLGKIAKIDQPLFLVGVHSACKTCKKLLPDLIGFARGFGDQFPFVLVANEPGYVPDAEFDTYVSLTDEDELFANLFRLDSRPFAVLINGSTLQPLGPPSLGDNAIRMLFAVTLNARNSAPA